MKRLIVIAMMSVMFLFFAYSAIAGEILKIVPEEMWEGEYTSITISYETDVMWYGGSIQVTIPDGWSPPNTNMAPGYVTAKVIQDGGGETSYLVAIAGQNIKIDSVNMSAGDRIEIIYGDLSYYGYAPFGSAYYPFLVSTNASGPTVDAYNGEQPVLLVKRISVHKSSNVTYAQAGDTIQYSINYMTNPMMGYEAFNTVIWDTLPSHLTYVTSSNTPALNIGNYIKWDLGTVSYYANLTLTVTAVVNNGSYPNITQLNNTAGVSSTDFEGNSNLAQFSNTDTIEVQGAILESALYAPDTVMQGQIFTVSMAVTNYGNAMATTVEPSVLTLNMAGGYVSLMSGPSPPQLSGLIAGNSEAFEWVYSAMISGQIAFSGNALGHSGTSEVYSNYSESNWMNIEALPTETFTPEPSVAPTDVPTATPTPNGDVNPDVTPTPRVTPNTEVYTDKNYFKPGETLEINYEVKSDEKVVIRIRNLNGEVVRVLVKDYQGQGKRQVIWDAKNDAGNTVGRGVYFIHIKQGNWQVMKKVVVLK